MQRRTFLASMGVGAAALAVGALTVGRRALQARSGGAGSAQPGGTAQGVASSGAASGATATTPATAPEPPAPLSPGERQLVDAIAPGTHAAHCEVTGVDGPRLGGITVTLRDPAGATFKVDVLRHEEGGPPGVAHTRSLELFIANNGDGTKPTDETHGLAAMALATLLERAEASGAMVPKTLVTHRERQTRLPSGPARASHGRRLLRSRRAS